MHSAKYSTRCNFCCIVFTRQLRLEVNFHLDNHLSLLDNLTWDPGCPWTNQCKTLFLACLSLTVKAAFLLFPFVTLATNKSMHFIIFQMQQCGNCWLTFTLCSQLLYIALSFYTMQGKSLCSTNVEGLKSVLCCIYVSHEVIWSHVIAHLKTKLILHLVSVTLAYVKDM